MTIVCPQAGGGGQLSVCTHRVREVFHEHWVGPKVERAFHPGGDLPRSLANLSTTLGAALPPPSDGGHTRPGSANSAACHHTTRCAPQHRNNATQSHPSCFFICLALVDFLWFSAQEGTGTGRGRGQVAQWADGDGASGLKLPCVGLSDRFRTIR